MITATVFNIQRFSLHDGPGIRTTVFLKGCPLRCLWCHNPESMDHRAEPSVAGGRCIGCDLCVPACSHGLTGRVDLDPAANRPTDLCERCGQCAEACPAGARQMLGRSLGAADLIGELGRDTVYFEESGGGVTFSGGEPLSAANAPLVLECLTVLKRAGTHTAIDTCGHVAVDTLRQAAQLTDLFLFDLKIMDPQRHRQATGQDNHLIHQNLQTLLAGGSQVLVRIPLIPGQTDDRANLEAIGDFLGEFPTPPPVHLLPYHAIAGDKYQRLGRREPLAGTRPLTDSEINERADWLAARGLQVRIGG